MCSRLNAWLNARVLSTHDLTPQPNRRAGCPHSVPAMGRLDIRTARGRKWTKRPINALTGRSATSTDPTTWTTFERALVFVERNDLSGIGFVVTRNDPFIGIDLDQCRNSDRHDRAVGAGVRQPVAPITDISPSASGLHIWIQGVAPGLLPDGSRGDETVGLRFTAPIVS